MRTTLTLDDDVAAMLKQLQRQHKLSLEEAVNRAMRAGLELLAQSKVSPGRPYRTRAVSLGRCLIDSVDRVADALAAGEGDDFR